GNLGNDLDIDSDYSNASAVGTLTSTSSDDTFITETAGDLSLKTVTAGSGATAFITNPVGSILNGNGSGGNVVSGNLWLLAGDDMGSSTSLIATRTGHIKGKSTNGDTYIVNTGAVTVGGVTGGAAGDAPDGLQAGGSITFHAHSPVIVSQDTVAGTD